MSAFKQNPFLVGFSVVMVLGVGALGYLAYSAADENTQARSEYDDTAGELKRLQTARPFPNDEHLKRFQEQRQQLQVKVDALQKELSGIKIPIEDISPTGFQDKLRDTVARVMARKDEANVTFPDKFFMGFANYQTEPPKGPASPPLYRQLRAIEEVVNLILEMKNVQLKDLTRTPLKEEVDAKPGPTDPKKPRPVEDDSKKLVQKNAFAIKFSATQENFQRILNGIVTNKDQFFIPRYIVVANDKPEPPPKVAVVAAPAPVAPTSLPDASATPPPLTDPAAPPVPAVAPPQEGPKLEYIFGKELVEVTMDIDLVDVKEPTPKAEAKEAKK